MVVYCVRVRIRGRQKTPPGLGHWDKNGTQQTALRKESKFVAAITHIHLHFTSDCFLNVV